MTTAKEILVGKVVCEVTQNGNQVVKVVTTAPNADPGAFVKIFPGVGKKFWYWPSIPAGDVIGADFTDAPTVTSDATTNNANIAAITADPADPAILFYA